MTKQKVLTILMLICFTVLITGCDSCECEVTYDYGGVLGYENETETYKKGTTIALEKNTVIDERNTLRGWSETKNGTPESFVTVDDDITLYAIWQFSYCVSTYYVYCSNYPDGIYSKVHSNDNYYEESILYFINKNKESSDGKYTCIGWTLEGIGGKLTTDTVFVKLDRDTTMIVVYEKNYFDITFNLNGGQGNIPNQISVKRGDYLNYTSLPTTGFSYGVYTFEGWSETKNGKVITSDFKPEKDMVLYAVWSHNGQVKDKTDDN